MRRKEDGEDVAREQAIGGMEAEEKRVKSVRRKGCN